jgi:hypothetical protein
MMPFEAFNLLILESYDVKREDMLKHGDVALNPAILLRTNEQYAWCAEYLSLFFYFASRSA